MNPLSFLSHLFHSVGQAAGGVAHGVGQAVNSVVHPQQPQVRPQASPRPQPVQPSPQTPIQPHISLQTFAHFLSQVPNIRLQGLEQGYNALHPGQQSKPITLGGVSHHLPLLAQAEQFAQQQGARPASTNPANIIQGEQRLATGIAKTGAHYAPYVAPELNVLKAGAGAGLAARIGAKTINNFVPGAATSAIADVASGNRNLQNIGTNALMAGAGNAGIALGGRALSQGSKAAAKAYRANPILADERGFIAGPKAAGFEDRAMQGKPVWQGLDRQARTQFTDAQAQLVPKAINNLAAGKTETLGGVIKDPVFKTQYGNLEGTLVHAARPGSLPKGAAAVFDETGKLGSPGDIHVDLSQIKDAGHLLNVLKEERQHAIQSHENFARGALPSSKDAAKVAPSMEHLTDQVELDRLNAMIDKTNQRYNQDRQQLSLSDPNFDAKLKKLAYKHNFPAIQDMKQERDYLQSRVTQTMDRMRNDPARLAEANAYQNSHGEMEADYARQHGLQSQAQLDAQAPDPTMGARNVRDIQINQRPAMAAHAEEPLASNVVENTLTKRGRRGEQDILSPETKEAISGEHVRRNTKQLLADAEVQAGTQGTEATIQAAHDALGVPDGQIDDKTVALSYKAIEAADSAGRVEDATALHDALSNHLLKAGQTTQAASLFYKQSAQGMLYKAIRDIKKSGGNITPELEQELRTMVERVKGLSGKERDYARAELSQKVLKNIPQGLLDNAISVWKAGLLSGSKTQSGNLLSNATLGALKKASDLPSALVDKGISLVTGKRTKTLTLRGGPTGITEGAGKGLKTLMTGIDERTVGEGDKYGQLAEINFKNPVIQTILGKPSNLVFRGMNAADQPFYYGALKNSLYDQAKADGLNAGLHGMRLQAHMKALVQDPPAQLVNAAIRDAKKAVLGHDTVASKFISGATKSIDNMQGVPKATKSVAKAVISVLAPFTKVPSAFLSRTTDFTPFGVGREVFEQAARKQFDQRALSTAIGEGATGTGLIALGVSLAQNGQLSGDYPKNDPKEQARWKAEHITPNAVKLGGNWISLNYLGPLGLLFGAGKHMADAGKQGENQLAAAVAGFGQGLLNQSFIQGFSGFSNAVQDPAHSAMTFLNSEVSSLVPSWLNDIANATDSMQRQTNNPLDALKARIPGQRQSLAPKTDAFGHDLTQASGSGLDTAINPLRPSKPEDSPLLSELNRLGGADQLVFPTPTKTIGQGKDAVKLTPEQSTLRQKMIGDKLTPLWNEIINSPDYKNLDDTHKHDVLQAALSDLNGAVDRTLISKIDASKLKGDAKGNVARILSGDPPTADEYLAKALGKPTTPGEKYKADLRNYQQKKQAGKLSVSGDFKALQDLHKEAITSKYSQDINDLFGMSKATLRQYFAQHPEQASLWGDVRKLDQELTAQGWQEKDKFAKGIGIAKKGKRGRKTGVHAHLASIHTSKAPSPKLSRAKKQKGIKLAANKSKTVTLKA